MTKAIGHASNACEHFRKSRVSRVYDTHDDSKWLVSNIEEATFGVCGLVEVCLRAVELILGTSDFMQAGEGAKKSLIRLLKSPEKDGIAQLNSDLEPAQLLTMNKLWRDNYDDFFSHMYQSTKTCLVDAVRLIHDPQLEVSIFSKISICIIIFQH